MTPRQRLLLRRRRRSLHALAGRQPAVPLLLALAAAGLFAWPAATTALEYDRAAIAAGELWRLVTGHLTHWSPDHLLLDVAALVLLGSLASPRRLALCLAAAAALIPAGLWWLTPEIGRYRGLSGLDAALFALVAVTLLRCSLRAEDGAPARPATAAAAALALAALAAKVGYELATGQALFLDAAAAGFVPVPLAHALGGLAGLAAGLAPRRFRLTPRDSGPTVVMITTDHQKPKPSPWIGPPPNCPGSRRRSNSQTRAPAASRTRARAPTAWPPPRPAARRGPSPPARRRAPARRPAPATARC